MHMHHFHLSYPLTGAPHLSISILAVHDDSHISPCNLVSRTQTVRYQMRDRVSFLFHITTSLKVKLIVKLLRERMPLGTTQPTNDDIKLVILKVLIH